MDLTVVLIDGTATLAASFLLSSRGLPCARLCSSESLAVFVLPPGGACSSRLLPGDGGSMGGRGIWRHELFQIHFDRKCKHSVPIALGSDGAGEACIYSSHQDAVCVCAEYLFSETRVRNMSER